MSCFIVRLFVGFVIRVVVVGEVLPFAVFLVCLRGLSLCDGGLSSNVFSGWSSLCVFLFSLGISGACVGWFTGLTGMFVCCF